MFDDQYTVKGFDDELYAAIRSEQARQEDHIELIASENYASPRVMAVQGSVLT
ncbi:MAG: serine hydroxymethyltransferase, partial [Wenzhouxiangella sp.]|nr:serine hydroxymethyltransferase [Wenzhouxiangella sp.]